MSTGVYSGPASPFVSIFSLYIKYVISDRKRSITTTAMPYGGRYVVMFSRRINIRLISVGQFMKTNCIPREKHQL